MSKFEILNEKTEYKEILRLCNEAEKETNPSDVALKCRDALNGIIAFIYEKEETYMPQSATMLELIDGKVVSTFAHYSVIIDSLHYIRKLGMNAQHGVHIKKTQAALALDNLAFFVEYLYKKIEKPDEIKNIILPKYMSELCDKYFSGKQKESLIMQFKINPLVKQLFSEVNPIPIKHAMNFLGYKVGKPRLPLTEIENKKTIEKELTNFMP